MSTRKDDRRDNDPYSNILQPHPGIRQGPTERSASLSSFPLPFSSSSLSSPPPHCPPSLPPPSPSFTTALGLLLPPGECRDYPSLFLTPCAALSKEATSFSTSRFFVDTEWSPGSTCRTPFCPTCAPTHIGPLENSSLASPDRRSLQRRSGQAPLSRRPKGLSVRRDPQPPANQPGVPAQLLGAWEPAGGGGAELGFHLNFVLPTVLPCKERIYVILILNEI